MNHGRGIVKFSRTQGRAYNGRRKVRRARDLVARIQAHVLNRRRSRDRKQENATVGRRVVLSRGPRANPVKVARGATPAVRVLVGARFNLDVRELEVSRPQAGMVTPGFDLLEVTLNDGPNRGGDLGSGDGNGLNPRASARHRQQRTHTHPKSQPSHSPPRRVLAEQDHRHSRRRQGMPSRARGVRIFWTGAAPRSLVGRARVALCLVCKQARSPRGGARAARSMLRGGP